jgi:hypothetical protein
VTPFNIAFMDKEDNTIYTYIDYFIDVCFFIDMILNFFSAYLDHEDNIIKTKKVNFTIKLANCQTLSFFMVLN